MRACEHHRARGQTMVFAAISMVAIIGAVGLVVDFGVFFVIQRQMQSAANAGALAAVWYPPVCAAAQPGCQTEVVAPVAGSSCDAPRHDDAHDNDETACAVAYHFALANLGPIEALCNGPLTSSPTPIDPRQMIFPYVIGLAPDPNVNVYGVTIQCDAQRWFGRILPGIGFTNHISTTGAATVGWLGANGDLSIVPLTPPTGGQLIARLVEAHATTPP
jgi:Putative Flp pilus-assembly TadE/G-like